MFNLSNEVVNLDCLTIAYSQPPNLQSIDFLYMIFIKDKRGQDVSSYLAK